MADASVAKGSDDKSGEADVYPFGHNAGHLYHGPMSMYKKNGFQKSGTSVH